MDIKRDFDFFGMSSFFFSKWKKNNTILETTIFFSSAQKRWRTNSEHLKTTLQNRATIVKYIINAYTLVILYIVRAHTMQFLSSTSVIVA